VVNLAYADHEAALLREEERQAETWFALGDNRYDLRRLTSAEVRFRRRR
jgi:hypothetical protein